MKRYANADHTEGSLAAASKGLWPQRYEVAEGTYLYRFVDITRAPSSKGADGPWWFEFEHFQAIKAFAERGGYTLGYAARLLAAILYEWSEVNAVVRARVIRGPLFVWKGKGKQVEGTGRDARDVVTQHGILTARPTGAGATASPAAQVRAARPRMTPGQGPLEVLQLFIPGLGAPHRQFAQFMKIESVEQIRGELPRV